MSAKEKKSKRVVQILNFNDYLASSGGNREEALAKIFEVGDPNKFITTCKDKSGQLFIFKV